MSSLDIVIVNWNSGPYLRECLISILEADTSCLDNVFVVDNNSDDESLAGLPPSDLIKIKYKDSNLGFAKGCNYGASFSSADFILFLNPDTKLYKNNLQGSLDFMNINKDIGILGIQLLNDNREITKSCSRFCSLSRTAFHSLGITKFFPALGMPMEEWDHKESREVDQVIGAYFFMRNDLFKKLKGFDERFFLFYEEMDFAFRAKQLGWKSYFNSDLKSYHAGGGTTDSIKATRLFYSLKSRIQYSFKNFNKVSAVIALLMILTTEFCIRLVFLSLFKKSIQNFRETFEAYLSLISWLTMKVISKITFK